MLLIISSLTDVSIFALNLATGMGLGLAIDYSLFVVSRYREELHNGRAPHDAVVRTVQTAGKTVAFSALTVAVALAALLVFPLAFLRSFAYAGIGVALLAGVGAVVSLPALLAVLGPRVNSLRLLRRDPKPVGEGVWHRIATVVMRRPVPIAVGVTALLILLGLPFLRIQFGLPDDRVLPTSVSSRQVQDDIRAPVRVNEAFTLQVVATDIGARRRRTDEIDGTRPRCHRRPAPPRRRLTGSYIKGQQVAGPGPITARFRRP